MRLRLAGGVVAASGLAAWLPRPSGPVRTDGGGGAAPGAPVALGPASADRETVERAVAELARLVRDGGAVAAGAGVELTEGFRSARLEGARGDQRDAVLAALKVLGVEEAGRLGARAGFLVALFGPSVTRRVGAAAAEAISAGRWAALHLATAASDVLGPEQLERILALEAPEGADMIAGDLPSALASNLRGALGPVPAARRLKLLVDLWERVAARHLWRVRRERLLATQAQRCRLGDLRERRERHEDDLLVEALRGFLGREPSVADAARWWPHDRYWHGVAMRVLQDSLAATALLHTAVAVSDHGLEEGLARSERLIRAVEHETVRNALDGGPDLVDLWALTSVRPLRAALDGLDPALRDRYDDLSLLLEDASLPGSLRKLVRTPQVAPVYSMGLVALRLRAAVGRLVAGGDRLVARSVARRTTEPLLCALAVAVTCGPAADGHVVVVPPRSVTVPGFPATTLADEDGPWRRAFPAARELGADTGAFWDRAAEDGLRVPGDWLPPGGWNALWARAHRPGER